MDIRPGLIGVDWGSTRFRAYLLGEDGSLLDKVENDQGIFAHKQVNHEEILYRSCEKWLRRMPEMPVLMAGMIGSRNGWFETGYLSCPVSVDSLTANIIPLPDLYSHPVYVVPGISALAVSGLPDVIRGEETQIFGVVDASSANNLMVCVPGTHSKWVQVENNKISHFSTFVTGEIFAAIRHCGSISSILTEGVSDPDAFMDGVGASQHAGGLLNHLFSVRACAVTNRNALNLNHSYLSGLLIGAEIKSALEIYPGTSKILVLGTDALIHDYNSAFSGLGIAVSSSTSEQAFIKGLWKLANASERVILTMGALYA